MGMKTKNQIVELKICHLSPEGCDRSHNSVTITDGVALIFG